MKIIIPLLVAFSLNVQAANKLACWDKRSSNRKPVLTATILNAKTLTNIVDNDFMIEGKIAGEINKKAIKYTGYLYFAYNVDNTFIETILPANFSEANGYFDAASRGTSSDGGGTTMLRCRVN